MILALKSGEEAAARLLKSWAQWRSGRDLSYRLFSICERKGWAGEALAYNGLVVAWPRLELAAQMQETPDRVSCFNFVFVPGCLIY